MTLFPPDPKKQRTRRAPAHREQERALISELATTLDKHGYLPMDVGIKRILASQVGVLLKDGYDFTDIRRAAIDIALGDNYKPQRLAYLAQRVRLTDLRREEQAHEERKLTEPPAVPAVSVLLEGVLKHIPARAMFSEYPAGHWNRRCVTKGCLRTALYQKEHCADHEKE